MTINRRQFLRGLGLAAAAAVIPISIVEKMAARQIKTTANVCTNREFYLTWWADCLNEILPAYLRCTRVDCASSPESFDTFYRGLVLNNYGRAVKGTVAKYYCFAVDEGMMADYHYRCQVLKDCAEAVGAAFGLRLRFKDGAGRLTG